MGEEIGAPQAGDLPAVAPKRITSSSGEGNVIFHGPNNSPAVGLERPLSSIGQGHPAVAVPRPADDLGQHLAALHQLPLVREQPTHELSLADH